MSTMRSRLLKLFVIPFAFFFIFTAAPVSVDACTYPSDSFLGIPAWYKYLPGEEDSTGRCAPSLGGGNEEQQVNSSLAIGVAVLEAILRISTFVALVMIFWGAFKFITTQGNSDNAGKSRTTVVNALIGFAIVLITSQVVAFIGRSIGG